MMTLTVTGAPDSHRGPVFLVGPDGQRGPDCSDVLYCRFPHRFRDFCEGFGCFRRSFGPRGPKMALLGATSLSYDLSGRIKGDVSLGNGAVDSVDIAATTIETKILLALMNSMN